MPLLLGPNVNPLYNFRIDLLNPHYSEQETELVPKYLQQVSEILSPPTQVSLYVPIANFSFTFESVCSGRCVL